MNTKKEAEIWKGCFEKLLNTGEPRELNKKGNKEVKDVEVEEVNLEVVKKAIRNLTIIRRRL